MAQISIEGLEELMNDLEAVAELPDGVVYEMLNEQAEVVKRAQVDKINELNLVDSGQLRASIEKTAVKTSGATRYLEVYPQGTRKNGVRNAEVGFYHEYGVPYKHIPAKNWMYNANEGCAEETTEAARKVYDNYLTSKNL